jgi:hypothetical protein
MEAMNTNADANVSGLDGRGYAGDGLQAATALAIDGHQGRGGGKAGREDCNAGGCRASTGRQHIAHANVLHQGRLQLALLQYSLKPIVPPRMGMDNRDDSGDEET